MKVRPSSLRTAICNAVVVSATTLWASLVVTCVGDRAMAADGPDYVQEIAPLFKKYCSGCHNPDEREGQLSLESFADLQRGGEHGVAVTAGEPASSRLFRLISGQAKPQMPPADEPQPTAAEVELIKLWIENGAKGPSGQEPDRATLVVPQIVGSSPNRGIAAVDFSADGNSLAVARYGVVEIMQRDGSAGWKKTAELDGLPGKVTAVHFVPDGKLLTASGVAGLIGQATLWDLASRKPLLEISGHRDILYDAELSPAGTLIATCGYDRRIILWNAQDGKQVRSFDGHNGAVYDVAFSPDGTILASASADDTCKVWRVDSGERLDTLGQPLKEQYSVTFSPDGNTIVAGGADNRIRVWRFDSRDKPIINPLLHARFAHEGSVARLAFTPNGRGLVSIAEDRTVKFWETAGYTEIKLFEQQPDVAQALAVSPTGQSFVVGRLDGTLTEYPLPDASIQRAVATATTAPAAPTTAPAASSNALDQEPNNAPSQAQTLTLPAVIKGTIEGPGDDAHGDLFKFSARKGAEWVFEVNAARSGSKLDSYIEVLDANGGRIERVQLQAVRDSYFTFRGKDANQSEDFRVFNWEEMELNEYLYSDGEVSKLWLYPRGPDSGFKVYPGAGNRYGYFDTTPVVHALGAPCYIVQPQQPGTSLIPNGLPVFTLYYQNDDESRRSLGADSKLYFTAPVEAEYLVRIRDIRGSVGPEFKYTLTARPRQPDFQVTLHGADPTVAAGSAREFRVEARRSDDFDGPITVDIDGLPPGFTATSPLVIEAGQNNALGVLMAAADAPAPTADNAKISRVRATAELTPSQGGQPGQTATHDVNNFGEIKLGPPPKVLVSIVEADGGAKSSGNSPQGVPEYEIQSGSTIRLKVRVTRDGYTGNVPFGNEDSGRNLPHGSYVDNIGLNGLLIVENTDERDFFVTAAKWLPPGKRLFHLRTTVEGEQASRPVLLNVVPH